MTRRPPSSHTSTPASSSEGEASFEAEPAGVQYNARNLPFDAPRLLRSEVANALNEGYDPEMVEDLVSLIDDNVPDQQHYVRVFRGCLEVYRNPYGSGTKCSGGTAFGHASWRDAGDNLYKARVLDMRLIYDPTSPHSCRFITLGRRNDVYGRGSRLRN